VSDEQRVDDAEHEREYGHLDPGVERHLDAAQDRYERQLGWTHD
jgi:hypothetical protein